MQGQDLAVHLYAGAGFSRTWRAPPSRLVHTPAISMLTVTEKDALSSYIGLGVLERMGSVEGSLPSPQSNPENPVWKGLVDGCKERLQHMVVRSKFAIQARLAGFASYQAGTYSGLYEFHRQKSWSKEQLGTKTRNTT